MSVLHGLQVTTIAQEEKFSLISGKNIMYTVPEIATSESKWKFHE